MLQKNNYWNVAKATKICSPQNATKRTLLKREHRRQQKEEILNKWGIPRSISGLQESCCLLSKHTWRINIHLLVLLQCETIVDEIIQDVCSPATLGSEYTSWGWLRVGQGWVTGRTQKFNCWLAYWFRCCNHSRQLLPRQWSRPIRSLHAREKE